MSPVSARPRRRGSPIHSRGHGGAAGVAGRARPLGGPPRPGQDLHLLLCALRAAGRFPCWAPAAEQPAKLDTDSDRLGLKKTGRPRRGPCLGARRCPRPTRLPPAPAPARDTGVHVAREPATVRGRSERAAGTPWGRPRPLCRAGEVG